MKRKKRRSVGFVGPMILISLGVVFLLNNLQITQLSVWELVFRFWPIFLITAGLDILIGRRSAWGSLVALVLTLAILAGAVWAFQSGASIGLQAAGETIAQPLGEAAQARVVIAPAVASLRVEPLHDSTNLVEGTISGEKVTPQVDTKGSKTTLRLESEGGSVGPLPAGGRDWELGLNDDVDLDLEISMGVGESDIDLTGLAVRELAVSMGIGQITVNLPGKGVFNAKVDGAIGEIVITIPKGMAARIELDTALVGRQLPEGYQCEEDVCTSPGYDAGADHKVNLEIDLAIGSVVIRQSSGK